MRKFVQPNVDYTVLEDRVMTRAFRDALVTGRGEEREARVMGKGFAEQYAQMMEHEHNGYCGALSPQTKSREEQNDMDDWKLLNDWREAKAAFDAGDEVEVYVLRKGQHCADWERVTSFRETMLKGHNRWWEARDTEYHTKRYRVNVKSRSVEAEVRATMEDFAKRYPFLVTEGKLLKIKGVKDDWSYALVDTSGRSCADYNLGDEDSKFLTLDEAVRYYDAHKSEVNTRDLLEVL